MIFALPELTISNLERRAEDPRGGRIIRTLCAIYPNSISAKQLMIRSGFSFHTDPVGSFISLCNLRILVSRVLSKHGFILERTGGTPDDHYRLMPVEAG